MSKYHEIYQLFVQDLKRYQEDSEACLNFGDRFAGEMLKYLDWREEDVEFVMLPQNSEISSVKGRRVNILESNLANLEKLSYWHKSLGLCYLAVMAISNFMMIPSKLRSVFAQTHYKKGSKGKSLDWVLVFSYLAELNTICSHDPTEVKSSNAAN